MARAASILATRLPSVALENGDAMQLAAPEIDLVNAQDLGAAAHPGRSRFVVCRVIVADAPVTQFGARGGAGLVLDQELEGADQGHQRQDRNGEPRLGQTAGIDRGQFAVAAQLGEGQQPGKQGRHRDQLGQDVRQLQHHVE